MLTIISHSFLSYYVVIAIIFSSHASLISYIMFPPNFQVTTDHRWKIWQENHTTLIMASGNYGAGTDGYSSYHAGGGGVYYYPKKFYWVSFYISTILFLPRLQRLFHSCFLGSYTFDFTPGRDMSNEFSRLAKTISDNIQNITQNGEFIFTYCHLSFPLIDHQLWFIITFKMVHNGGLFRKCEPKVHHEIS